MLSAGARRCFGRRVRMTMRPNAENRKKRCATNAGILRQ